jgi:predicted nuclease of restriction endonuclease-like RecB superfamily
LKSSKASSNDSIPPAAATTLNDTEPKKRRTLLKSNATSTDQNKDPKRKRRRATDVVRKVLSRTKKARTSEELGPIVIDEHIRSDEDEYVVHPDFRLQRSSFNRDVILGMAKHDRENKCRVLEAAPYVADMFQHHFSLEVSL